MRKNQEPRNHVEWPADSVERRPVAALVPAARNARTHSPEQVKQIAESIVEFGWTVPALVDEDGTLICGHGRILAAKQLGIETVPVMVARGWTDAQIKAYRIADNQIALNADWNPDNLKMEFEGLRELGFNMSLTGFSPQLISVFTGEGLSSLAGEWEGMPEFEHVDKSAFRSIVVNFADQNAVDEFAKAIGQAIGPKTKSIWFPPQIETYADKRYAYNSDSPNSTKR
jgi:ParB-like chromosome segregation protein Spo0J